MSAFNRLFIDHTCRACGAHVRLPIQFKYGDCWQHDYEIGDSIRWGGNDSAVRVEGRVEVLGIAEGCPACNQEMPDSEVDYLVLVKENRIVSARPTQDITEFVQSNTLWLVRTS